MLNRIFVSISIIMFISLVSCDKRAETIAIEIKGTTFTVECARTKEQQQKGLMFRKKLGKREGMIFIYTEYVTGAFWMLNTPLPLSIAFIAHDGKILDIKDMRPYSMEQVYSRFPYMYALEVNIGTFKEIGAGIGDYMILPDGFK
jgi:uncharacterized membrane protein (UPF0127 family)